VARIGGTAAALVLALGTGAAVLADEVRVSATVHPTGRIFETTQVRLVVQIDGGSIPEVSTPKLPAMTNLRVGAGPSTSRNSSYSFVNGRVDSSNTLTLTYVLLPEGPGPAEIPAFDVVVGGTPYRTQAIHLTVQQGRAGPGVAPPRGRAEENAEEDDDVDVYLEARVSPKEVWVGEAATLEVAIYAGAPITGFTGLQPPALAGMWSDDVPVDANRERRSETVGGRSYSVFPIERKLLIPTRPGRLEIAPFLAQVQVRRSSRDPFRSFFTLGEFVNLLRKTRPIQLTAKALPEEGRPPEFGGAVGSFRLRLAAAPQSVAVGDAVAIRATVEGRGSLQAVPPPHLAPAGELKTYEPKVVEDERGGLDRLVSRKTWEWIVVPVRPGEFKLPAATFGFFDPASARYVVVSQDLPVLAVRRGEGPVEVGSTRREVQAAAKDIAFLKPRGEALREAREPLARRPGFVALFAIPWALVPLGIWWGRRQERLQTDTGFARSRRAARSAARRLAKAAAHAEAGPFHEDVARALVDYVADRANRSAAGLTYEEVDALLSAQGVDETLRRRYRACLERCDFARFVPDAPGAVSRSDVAAEARAIIGALEAAW
jgi:hypothetical protein